jgi:hypothetical protein
MTTLSERIDRFQNTHYPVTAEQLAAAYALRVEGLSYNAIEVVMRRYHGAFYAADTWRAWMRKMGAPATKVWHGAGACAPTRRAA